MSYGAIYPYTWWGSPIKDGWGGIYYNLAYSYLLDKFGGAAAAYSLRSLSAETTNVVKVRRDSDNAERDFSATEVSDGTLESWVNGELDALPLDTASAAAAYSLRNLSTSYSGSVVRVRRSSDNAESDFTAAEVSDGTLLSWVGTSGTDNGFVTTWYDQAGSNDATQSTAANQPQIVSSGSVITENGKSSVQFDGVNDGLLFDSSGLDIGSLSSLAVGKYNALDNTMLFGISGATGNKRWYAPFATASSFRFGYSDNSTASTTSGDTNQHLFTMIAGSTLGNMESWIDGSSIGTYALSSGIDPINGIGNFDNGFYADCKAQEIIIYASDQSTNRIKIENNINTYYDIYSSVASGYVATWYDQSSNGNNATQATASSQPLIVDSGVLVTENGKASLSFDGTDDYLSNSLPSTISQPTYWFLTHNFHATPSAFDGVIGNFSTDTEHRLILDSSLIYTLQAGGAIKYNSYQTSQSLVSYKMDASDERFYFNGSEQTASSGAGLGSDGLQSIILGSLYETFGQTPIKFQEIILYPSDQTDNRADIENEINNYYTIYAGSPISGLLYDYPSSAAAYSVRQLTIYDNAYKETLVKVRRSSDNAEVDVKADTNYEISLNSFTSAEMSLGDWIGSDDGYVTTWYDQSGNDNDAVQATASSQPQLISGGVVNLENGKAALDFDGSDDYLFNSFTTSISSGFTITSVVKENSLPINNGAYNIGTNLYGISKFYNSNSIYTPFTIAIQSSVDKFRPTGAISRNTNQNLILDIFDGVDKTLASSVSFSINGSLIASTIAGSVAPLNSNEFRIGRAGASFAGDHFDGKYQEFIVYPTDQSANRTSIETNINNYFNIY